MKRTRLRLTLIIGIILSSMISGSILAQQRSVPIDCGAVLEAELASSDEKHNYTLDLGAGDILAIGGEPIGDTLNLMLWVYDPQNTQIAITNNRGSGGAEEMQGLTVSATGRHTITVGATSSTIGAYNLSVGCTLRNGTIIEPGDAPQESTSQSGIQRPFTGIGFPGLPPADFTNAILLPFNLEAPNVGGFNTGFDAVFGFTLDASAGDTFVLNFERTAGNLNLGLVVLSANNEVVFQASLVTLETLSARMTLPSAGQYTIGVFRIDLLPPAAPEATQFQITGTLNP